MIEKITDVINNIFHSKSRTSMVIKNSMLTAIIKVASMLCSFIIVPITLNYLNAENYGIWMAITNIMYWLALMNVGLGNGMRNYLSAAISEKNYNKARAYFSTATFMITIVTIIIGIIVIPFVYSTNLNKLFNTYNISNDALTSVLVIAIIFTLIQFIVTNIGMVYIAMQKYAINDFLTFLGNLSAVIIIYILTKTTEGNLTYVVAAFTGMPIICFLGAAIPLMRRYPQLIPTWQSVDFSIAKDVVGKGLGFFAIQITSCLVIFGSTNVIISHYCGPENVTVYNISYKLFNIIITAYTILISPLWNAYTDAAVNEDYSWIRTTFFKSVKLWVLTVIAGIILLFLSKWIFRIWIGNSVEIPFEVSICILLYICVFNFNNCVTYLINGLNKIYIQIITSLIVTLLYLITVYTIKGDYGITGISLAMASAYIIMGIVHLYQCHLFINNKATGIWNK